MVSYWLQFLIYCKFLKMVFIFLFLMTVYFFMFILHSCWSREDALECNSSDWTFRNLKMYSYFKCIGHILVCELCFQVSSNNIVGGVLLQSPSLHDFDQREMLCFYLFPGRNFSEKVCSLSFQNQLFILFYNISFIKSPPNGNTSFLCLQMDLPIYSISFNMQSMIILLSGCTFISFVSTYGLSFKCILWSFCIYLYISIRNMMTFCSSDDIHCGNVNWLLKNSQYKFKDRTNSLQFEISENPNLPILLFSKCGTVYDVAFC